MTAQQKVMYDELEMWRQLVSGLVEAGAVTNDDCHSPQQLRDSRGLRLLAILRAWGDARFRQGQFKPEPMTNEIRT